MINNKSLTSKKVGKGQIIPELNLPGPEQMALDELLLKESISNSNIAPKIRFYEWEGTWLSLGRNQQNLPNKWKALVRQKKINLVRRTSGGSSVLHLGGLTYSLIWPLAPRK